MIPLHPLELLLVGATALVAAFISSLSAAGLSIVLLPVLVLYMGVKEAVPILAITLLAAGVSRVWVNLREIDWPVLRWCWAGALPGAVLGAFLFTRMPAGPLTRLLGMLLLGLLAWRRLRPRPPRRYHPAWFLPVGLGFGAVSGMMSGAGPLLAPFYLAYGLRTGAYIGTAGLVGLGTQAAKLAVFGGTAVLTPRIVAYGLYLVPISVLGTLLGKRLMAHCPDWVFVAIIETVMLVGGVTLLLRG